MLRTMAARMFKWFAGSFLISLMLLVGMIPAGYFIYRDGAELVKEVQTQARSRASQLTVALGAQASEAASPEALVALCETMKELVQDSQESARGFAVEESFLIDLDGRILAHNDVAKVASDSGITYNEAKYEEVLLNSQRYPLDLKTIGHTDYRPDAPLSSLIPFLERYQPDLRANRFHVAYAVYLPDADVPAGSLHVFLRNDGIDRILDIYWGNVLRTLTYSVITYVVLTIILSILLAFTIFGGQKRNALKPEPIRSSSSADWEAQPFEEVEAPSEPLNAGGQAGGGLHDWPEFPGASKEAPTTRTHNLADMQYEAPRTIDRDILDAIPLSRQGENS